MPLSMAPGTKQEPLHIGDGICYDTHNAGDVAGPVSRWVGSDAVARGPMDGTSAVTCGIGAGMVAYV